jgi:Cu2+-containing amine oxidase
VLSELLSSSLEQKSHYLRSYQDPIEPFRMDSEILNPRVCSPGGHRFAVESAGEMTADMEHRKLQDEALRARLIKENRVPNHRRGGRTAMSPRSTRPQSTSKQQARQLESSGAGGDGSGHMVSWLDWTFHVSVDRAHGMVIRNLKFKGERVAYELSIQEYFASYSSIGSTAQVFYYDSNYEIGTELSELLVGVDCPEDALYLPVLLEEFTATGLSEPAHMCIFEQTLGEPMWRHGYAGGGAYPDGGTRGLPRTTLSVRTISTMGNYDYIPTFSVMADGVIDMKVELGGYMLTSYAPSAMDNVESPVFGEKVHEYTNGILHDHILGFKADLDVGGTANSLETWKVKYGTFEEATGKPKPGWHSYNGVKYVEKELHETEGALYAKDYEGFLITSEKTNSWGAPVSYELHFDSTVSSQAFPRDHPMVGPQEWAFSNLAVTTFKDEERYCSYPSNFNVVGEPFAMTDLAKFKDGESIVEEDLVLWIMVGKQHYPKAEDVPLVSNFGTGFQLKPRNIFDQAAFKDLADYPSAAEEPEEPEPTKPNKEKKPKKDKKPKEEKEGGMKKGKKESRRTRRLKGAESI